MTNEAAEIQGFDGKTIVNKRPAGMSVTEWTWEGFEPWTLESQAWPLNWLGQREFSPGQAVNWPGDFCCSSTSLVLPPSGH